MLENLALFISSSLLVPNWPIINSIWRAFIFLAPLLIVAAAVQAIFPAIKRRPKLLSLEMANDVIYAMQTGFIYLSIFGTVVGISRYWAFNTTGILFPSLTELPFVLQVALGLWCFDFLVYWRHRLEHEISVIWPIHAVHHSSKQVDTLTTTRLHIFEVVLGGIIAGWATMSFGISSAAASLGFTIYLYHNYYIHTNLNIRYPGFLKYIFVSPFMHRWHHGAEKEAINCNYAVVFAFHDWLFGSAYHPNHEPSAYGFHPPPGEELPESYFSHQLYPFKVWGLRLLGLLQTLVRNK